MIYIVGRTLLIAVVLAAVWLDRWTVPVILIALGAGILFGSDVQNLWHFDDIELTNQVANFALVLILFHGGFSTRQSDFKAVALPLENGRYIIRSKIPRAITTRKNPKRVRWKK